LEYIIKYNLTFSARIASDKGLGKLVLWPPFVGGAAAAVTE